MIVIRLTPIPISRATSPEILTFNMTHIPAMKAPKDEWICE